jgi:multicomponent Na+:H+ antiporter subunit A
MLLGGWLALRAVDLKLLLAYSTVSQLGFMIAIAGIGTKAAMTAALTVMMAHALFKAALFMVVGVIDHATGTRDMRKLAGLGRKMPGLMWIAIVAAASAAGIPPLLGFVAKEAALDAILHASIFPEPVRAFLVVGIVGGSILTFAYCLRFLVGAFGGRAKGEDTGGFWVHGRGAWQGEPSPAVAIAKPQSALFIAPAAILAGLGLISGLLAPWFQNLLVVYVGHFPGEEYKLALWHGFNLPLFLTLAVFALGLIAFAIWGYRGLTDRRPWFGSSDAVYDWVLATMDTLSIRFTAFTQRGSVPLIQTVTLVTLMLLPTLTMVFGPNATARLILWESPAQFAIAIIISAVAVGVAFTRNRLGGAIMVGLTGYGCAVIFALRGAPDLALTQFLVETLTLVVFVLILRKLPAEVDHTMTLKAPRVLLAFGIGVGTATLGAIAMAARRAPSLAEPLAEGAVERAHGTNIVNVLLVDIRAWDTMGEISVLVVAATGVASLVFRNRRFGSAPRVSDAPTPRALRPQAFHTTWLLGGRLTDPRYRSLILEVTTRLIFPTIMVLSLHFFFAGHNAPGGGFAGGLTAALALVLRYLAGGRYELGETVAVDAGKVLGAGLLCSAGAAAGSLVLGAPVLSSAKFELTAPIFGHFTANTALLFDLGVYLVVVGLALDVLRSLGVRLDTKIEVGSR